MKSGLILLVPILESKGFSKDQIDKAKNYIKSYNKQLALEEKQKNFKHILSKNSDNKD